MIPLRDTTKTDTFPYVNLTIISINILVYIYEIALGDQLNNFIIHNGLIPSILFTGADISIVDRASPIFTSMFIHGDFLHIAGNMLFLYIFGNNVESRMGHFKFFLFYIICGIGAAAFQVLANIHSIVPMIGASGAISGILGAYLTYFPRSRILTLVPIIIYIKFIHLPAALFIFIWFLIQFLGSVSTIGMDSQTGGIAFWAHIGGFVIGLILARYFQKKKYYKFEVISKELH
ncbi:MAG: rhomboid family intramembrane serine protease [Thermodesulfobacteriota bacterium]